MKKDVSTRKRQENNRLFHSCDPVLYDGLRHLRQNQTLHVQHIETLGFFHNSTVFFAEPLTFEGIPAIGPIARKRRIQCREAWLQRALDKTANCELVFVDPDNGLEIPSTKHYHLALPAPAFTLIRGRPWWGILPYRLVASDPDSLARCALGRLPVADADAPDPLGEIRRQLPRIRQWILGLPPLSNENFAVLEGIVPALALVDPNLPAVALDRQRMKAAIQAGRGTNSHKKADELRTLDSRFFTGCLCCGLALTVQSLANNHFEAIGRLLRYPEWYADIFWLGLAPKVIAAVLLQKVIALRELVQGRL